MTALKAPERRGSGPQGAGGNTGWMPQHVTLSSADLSRVRFPRFGAGNQKSQTRAHCGWGGSRVGMRCRHPVRLPAPCMGGRGNHVNLDIPPDPPVKKNLSPRFFPKPGGRAIVT